MNLNHIEKNVAKRINNFNEETFVYDLLLAYGFGPSLIARLKNGLYNLSKVDGEVSLKRTKRIQNL